MRVQRILMAADHPADLAFARQVWTAGRDRGRA